LNKPPLMPHTTQTGPNPNPIQDVAVEFEVCARRAIECLLNRPTLSYRGFGPQVRFPAEPEIRCSMVTSNPDHSVAISLGLSKQDLRNLLSGEKEEDMALDAIREIVNILAGRLFVGPVFHSRFGYMRATVPTFGLPGPDLGHAEVLRGVLIVGPAHFSLELAIVCEKSGGVA
jgi:hypothetical protein